MNEFAPQHSRLFKEVREELHALVRLAQGLQMIIVASPAKAFLHTPKGNVRRDATIVLYQREIDDAYDAVAASAQEDIPAPPEWSTADTLIFVRRVVLGVIKAQVSDMDDIFQHGCDRCASENAVRLLLTRSIQLAGDVDQKLTRPRSAHNSQRHGQQSLA
jgi:hypothetical protein